MGFSTMNCTSSGRINVDFFFSTRLYLHVAIFSLIQNKKCILLTLSVCVLTFLEHHKSHSSCFPDQSRTQFVEINEQNIVLFLGGLGLREIQKSIVTMELLYRTIGAVIDPPPH